MAQEDILKLGKPHTGDEAIRILLDQRGQRPGVDFNALASNNDRFALQAADELRLRGLRVPEDVHFAGFDNDEIGRSSTPTITTAPFPTYELGRNAVKVLLAKIAKEEIPQHLLLVPSKIIVRQSCGCLDAAVQEAACLTAPEAADLQRPFKMSLSGYRDEILLSIERMGAGVPVEQVERLLEGILCEIEHSYGRFLPILNDILNQVIEAGKDVSVWQDLLSALRQQILIHLHDNEALIRMENLWGQARVMVSGAVQRLEMAQKLEIKQCNNVLNEIIQKLITTYDNGLLWNVLAKELPRVGITSCYLSLYENGQKPAGWSRLMLAYNEKERFELDEAGLRFPSRDLIPECVLPPDRQFGMVVEPLYFQEDQIGFVLFEMKQRDAGVFEVLRGQISSALRGVMLYHKVKSHARELSQAYDILQKQQDELIQAGKALEHANKELTKDITERKRAEEALDKERRRLQKALDEVRTLRGIVPICSSCKKIRDDQGYWNQVEVYVRDHTEAEFSHAVCPECMKRLYPEFARDESKTKP